jgi:4'-phosphopantetheinyl transferase superfamily
MRSDHRRMSARLSAALGVPVQVALVPALGRQCPGPYGSEPPQRVAARRALRIVRRSIGEGHQAKISFPHARFSISHAGATGAAVGVAPGATAGVGVDFEPIRQIDPATARFFLTEREQAWVAGLSSDRVSAELLRLWTVKEAVFKADLGNAHALVGDYEVEEPAAITGTARRVRGHALPCRYSTLEEDLGLLTVAVTPLDAAGRTREDDAA